MNHTYGAQKLRKSHRFCLLWRKYLGSHPRQAYAVLCAVSGGGLGSHDGFYRGDVVMIEHWGRYSSARVRRSWVG